MGILDGRVAIVTGASMLSSGGPRFSTDAVTNFCSLSRWAGVVTFSSFSSRTRS